MSSTVDNQLLDELADNELLTVLKRANLGRGMVVGENGIEWSWSPVLDPASFGVETLTIGVAERGQSTRVEEHYSARTHKFALKGWTQGAFRGSSPWVDGSLELSQERTYRANNQIGDLYLTAVHQISAGTIALNPRLKPNPDFVQEIQDALQVRDPNERIAAVQDVFHTYGHVIPTVIEVGGAKVAESIETEVNLSEVQERKQDLKSELESELEQHVRKGGDEDEDEDEDEDHETSGLSVTTIGGRTVHGRDTVAWNNSCDNYRYWLPISIRRVIPTFHLLDPGMRRAVEALGAGQATDDFSQPPDDDASKPSSAAVNAYTQPSGEASTDAGGSATDGKGFPCLSFLHTVNSWNEVSTRYKESPVMDPKATGNIDLELPADFFTSSEGFTIVVWARKQSSPPENTTASWPLLLIWDYNYQTSSDNWSFDVFTAYDLSQKAYYIRTCGLKPPSAAYMNFFDHAKALESEKLPLNVWRRLAIIGRPEERKWSFYLDGLEMSREVDPQIFHNGFSVPSRPHISLGSGPHPAFLQEGTFAQVANLLAWNRAMSLDEMSSLAVPPPERTG